MVGAAAACLLAQQGWRIAVVEQSRTGGLCTRASDGSSCFCDQPGIGGFIATSRCLGCDFGDANRAYTELATWEVSGLETHFHAHEAGVSASWVISLKTV